MPYSPPSLQSRALSPCMPLARCRRPAPSRLPALTSLGIARPPFDSAASVGVQPAAEPRHVQRHNHGGHALRALRACPCQQPPQFDPPARCLRRGRPTPPRLPARLVVPRPKLPSRLGRLRTRCQPPTSSSSVAHGRAPRPLRLLAMARAGLQGPARPHSQPRPPCGQRSKPTMPTWRPPRRRTAPSRAGASRQSQT